MIKTRIRTTVIGTLLLAGVVATAQKINPARHPNLAAAQRFTEQAYDKIVQAQKANEYDLGGHAQKAKELLEQVNQQLKEAAADANKK